MSEESVYNLQEIDSLIQLSKETIEGLKRDGRRAHNITDSIAVAKNITRLTEDIRRLVRVRLNLIKENGNKTNGGEKNESE